MAQRFAVGTVFKSRGKIQREMTVVDFWTTTNLKGSVVRERYVVSHRCMGQTVLDYDVVDATIARGLENLEKTK